MKIKLKDIAEKAGVSVNTVSMAIRDMPGIKDETKENILKVANELGYFYQRTKIETQNIGLISTSEHLRDSYFYMSFQQRIMQQVHQYNYNVMVYDDVFCNMHTAELKDILEHNGIRGIILLGDMDEGVVNNIVGTDIPAICIGARYYETDLYTLIEDNFAGANMAVQYLVKHGCRRIGFVGRTAHSIAFLERYLGVVGAVQRLSLPYNERWYITDMDFEEEYDFLAITKRIKDMHEIPDAFICGNDNVGIVVSKALCSMNLDVPKDISLIGFDSSDIGKMANPSLTSIDVQCALQSETSVKVLMRFIEEGTNEVQRVLLPVLLVEGDSVAKD